MNKKKIKRNNTKIAQIVMFIFSVFIFLLMSGLLITNNISDFDKLVYSWISNIISEPMTRFFKLITLLCNTSFMVCLLIVILIILKNKKKALVIILNTLFCSLLNQFTKMIFVRPRPTGINIIEENGYSFPSGHSMVSLAFYGLLIYLVVNSNLNKNKKILLSSLLSILILLIGISRIYLGVHYASDVLGGFSLAMAYLIVSINLLYKKMER